MNENMSTGKIFVGGVGIVGLIGAAIYIYKRVKEANKPIEITLDEGTVENAESVEGQETTESGEETKSVAKAEKKAAITEKISKVSKKIGKTIGTFCLKFGAKHPKIAKGLLQFGKYIPYAALGIAVLASLPFYNRARDFMEGVDPDSINVTDDGIEFTRYLPEETEPRKMAIERSDEKLPTNGWDEKYRDNFNAVKDFANTLNLFEGEMFIIEDQKQYAGTDTFANLDEEHPIVSHLIDGTGVYPNDNEQ